MPAKRPYEYQLWTATRVNTSHSNRQQHRASDPEQRHDCSSLELIAEASDRDQVLRVGRIGLDLRSQPLDVDVQGLSITDVIRAPDPINQLAASHHSARVTQQHFQ